MVRLSALLVTVATVFAACSAEEPTAPGAVDGQAEAPAPSAPPSDAAYQGAGLARQVCSQCHHVTAGPAPGGLPAASFGEIANRPGVSADSIRTWLTSTHPTMPNFMFDRQTVEQMTAYIMSLRNPE